jgi:twitching motility protein PilT
MSLVDSLLAAIVRADGDALVMHAGEKPYVVASTGSVELSTRPLTLDAMQRMVSQLLDADERRALDEAGAVERQLPRAAAPGERFTLVAARGGDDVWVEIRRHRKEPAASARVAASPAERGEARGPAPVPERKPDREGTRPEVLRPASWVAPEPPPAVVVPMQRGVSRPEAPASPSPPTTRAGAIDRLLRLAAVRGASTMYVVADARPMIRVDGEIVTVEGERPLAASEVEGLILEWAAEPGREEQRDGFGTEWIRDVPEVGRVRCLSFRDHRGPGGVFNFVPTRALSAEQLGLSREIQSLAGQPDGLVLVTGQRLSGKSTLISAFVDLINRSRSEHIITLERQIKIVHESRRSFVSQREVRGEAEEMLKAARAALREDPDVLVIEDLRSPEITSVALEAADSGRLVLAALAAPNTAAAIERLLDQFPPDRRSQTQHTLASSLRGVVAQSLLRKTGGGRLAARELLLNTPAVAALIAEGKTFQLPLALESGRKHGMVPLNDALAGFVQGGAADAREAYRKAVDREGLLNLLKRAGIDTSFVERLA